MLVKSLSSTTIKYTFEEVQKFMFVMFVKPECSLWSVVRTFVCYDVESLRQIIGADLPTLSIVHFYCTFSILKPNSVCYSSKWSRG